MKIVASFRIAVAMMTAVSLLGCDIHPRTIREYRTGPGGTATVANVTEDAYWKERVDERIENELKKEKPEGGHETWQEYWQWWYSVLRRKRKPTWKSKEFKTSEQLVNYIKEKRRAKGLPTYEE